jgi:thiol-disulfide isomerase/thioredoxin
LLSAIAACILFNVASACGATDSVLHFSGSGIHVGSEQHRLERLDESKFRRLVKDRHGRALFVNFWATWCAPCVEEFPDVVRIANEMKDRNIDFVGVSADDFDDESSKVIPFIAKQKALFKFYIAKLEGEDAFIDAVDKKWGGGIPATFVYDSHGRKKAFLLGKQTYRGLKAAVQKVVDH